MAVGYMDSGNWITSVVGGASYKHSLLFVILISSIISMQLQQMAGKLGIVTRMDSAHHAPKWFRYSLWVILELALMATDLAEVFGSAIVLNLLFKNTYNGCYPTNRFRCISFAFVDEIWFQGD